MSATGSVLQSLSSMLNSPTVNLTSPSPVKPERGQQRNADKWRPGSENVRPRSAAAAASHKAAQEWSEQYSELWQHWDTYEPPETPSPGLLEAQRLAWAYWEQHDFDADRPKHALTVRDAASGALRLLTSMLIVGVGAAFVFFPDVTATATAVKATAGRLEAVVASLLADPAFW